MKTIRRYISIYRHFFRMDLRRLILYPANLLASSFGYLIESLAVFFSVWLVIRQVGTLAGWNMGAMFALFSYTLFLSSVWDFFFVNTLEIPYLIRTGELDVFLLRPLGVLFQFVVFELDEESVFEVITSFVIFISSIVYCDLSLSFAGVLLFLLATISALMGLEAIYLAISSTAFWFTSTGGLKSIAYQLLGVTRYPLTIYPKTVRVLMTVLPFGLYGYYPLHLLLFQYWDWINILYTLGSGPVFLTIAYFGFWKNGLRHYTSAAG